MATLSELKDLQDYEPLRDKVESAMMIKAQSIVDEVSPTATRLAYAREVLMDTRSNVQEILNYVLAANNSLSVAAIQGASDSAIQTNADAAIDGIVP